MTAWLEVLEPGPLSTVQDLGRWGSQGQGFSVCGAADPRSLMLANALVGNAPGQTGLEVTLRGPRLRFEADTTVAVVGAGCEVVVAGRRHGGNRSWRLRPGEELSIRAMAGARAYLAFAGGVQLPPFLGSRSTDLWAGVGGLEGRALRAGDRLPVPESRGGEPMLRLRDALAPVAAPRVAVRFSDGPQAGLLLQEQWLTMLSSVYSVSPVSDRMGIRLQGPPLAQGLGEVLSEGHPAGAIQLPGDGRPMILLAGRQTIGGYPKVGVVGQRSLWELAQALPGTELTFERVGDRELLAETRRWLSLLQNPAWLCRPADQELV